MTEGIIIKVADPDDDYLGIEVLVSSEQFCGATRIYAGLDELSTLATYITGFPKDSRDERRYEFGSRDERIAGGYCSLRFHAADMVGHSAIEVEIEDDDKFYKPAMAKMIIRTEAARIDEFVRRLQQIETDKAGEARI